MDPLSAAKEYSRPRASSSLSNIVKRTPKSLPVDTLKPASSFDKSTDAKKKDKSPRSDRDALSTRPRDSKSLMDYYAQEIKRFNEEFKHQMTADSDEQKLRSFQDKWVEHFKAWKPSDDFVSMLGRSLQHYLEKKDVSDIKTIKHALPQIIDELVPESWCKSLNSNASGEQDHKQGANYGFCLGIHYALKAKETKDEASLKKAEAWSRPAQSVELFKLLSHMRGKKRSPLYDGILAEQHKGNSKLQQGRNEIAIERETELLDNIIGKMEG